MNPLFQDTDFRKAGGSGTGDCVEVAITARVPDRVGLRDSKNPRGTILLLTSMEWRAFTEGFLESRSPTAH
ncbi:DUF397 domain-containing protein [Nocardiopsis alkaliphila]|uniref:DUF397 domain-containing protein n=1 Tax=Nocardiopsis alkaliphila TaxID=225762 RepID=UPI00034BDDE5|nr:DUF397 domain-containing protein [Nocardiopsis alkaliphila]